MRTQTSVILAALGAVALGLGIVYGTGPTGQTQQAADGRLVFPGLVPKLASAERIEIVHKGVTLVLDRTGKQADAGWGVAGRGNYPAEPGKVHALLASLTELRLDELRTSDPAQYVRLGVEDPAGKGADSTLLRVLDGKGGTIASLIVGHARSAMRGSADTLYVRQPTEKQSWLADGRLAPGIDPLDWVDRSIVSIDAAKVASDVVTRDNTTLTFRPVADKLALTDPADHPKLDDGKLEQVGSALTDLTMQDVRRAPAPGTPLGRAVVTTTEGMIVTVDASKDGANLWATLTASGKDAARLDQKLHGWAYQIDGWRQQALVPTLADIKAAEPAAAAAPPASTPAAPVPAPPTPVPLPK